MDTNNNNQLLHTFEKGMDTDTSDAWLESGKYRSARNLRYLTDNGENTGELHSIEGFEEKLISLNDEDVVFYGHEVSVGQYYLDYRRYYKMLAEVREYDIQGREFVTGDLCCYDGSVWRCNVEEGEIVYGGDPFDPTQWYAYHDADELNSEGYTDPAKDAVIGNIIATTQVRNIGIIVSVDENSKWRVYTINKDHQNPYSTTLRFGPCETTIGNNYQNKLSLVTRWEDDDNIKLYIADGEHELMVVNLVLELGATIPSTIEQITNNLSLDLLIPEITGIIGGNLKPALVQYSYQLYNRYGIQSTISPVSKLVNIIEFLNSITYGLSQNNASTVGIQVRIKFSSIPIYEKIKIYRITYLQIGQPASIDLVCDTKISLNNNNEFLFSDVGNNEISKISVAEYQSSTNLGIIPTTIESKNDYLFVSNIKYKHTDIFDNWDSRAYTTGCYYIANGIEQLIPSDFNLNLRENIYHTNWNLYDDFDSSSWLKQSTDTELGGVGPNISWEFVLTDQLLDEEPYRVGIIKSYNLSSVQTYLPTRTLKGGEMYRYGIILYDEKGYRSEVKWIADIRVPDIDGTITNPLLNPSTYEKIRERFYINGEHYGRCIGIKFTIEHLPSECVGYEIVRANRTQQDISNITQGAISRMLVPCDEKDSDNGYDQNYINDRIPTGFITLDQMNYINKKNDVESFRTWSKTYTYDPQDTILFFSSEVAYLSDDILNVLKTNQIKLYPLWFCRPDIFESEISGIVSSLNEFNGKYKNPSILYDNDVESGVNFKYTYDDSEDYNHTFSSFPEINVVNIWNRPVNENEWSLKYPSTYHINECRNESNYDRFVIDQEWHTETIKSDVLKKEKIAYNPICYVKFKKVSSSEIDSYYGNGLLIQNIKLLQPKGWDDFGKQDTIDILNHVVPSGQKNVHQWSSPYLSKQNQISDAKTKLSGTDPTSPYCGGVIGISGKSLVFNLIDNQPNNDNNVLYWHKEQTNRRNELKFKGFYSCICSLKKPVNPYGGQEYETKANNVYVSYGNYKSSSEDSIYVYDGDCFLSCFECQTMYTWYHPQYNCHVNLAVVYSFPVETQINIEFDHGNRYSKLNANNISTINRDLNFLLNEATLFVNYYTQQRPMYQYNTAYSMVPNVLISTGVPQEDIKNNKYDYRTYYSNIKTNNELVDSWTQFKSANYLDADTRYGEITDLRTFKDRLIFWQNEAVGLFSVNERTMLQDQNDYNIILGNGDVLLRYDYITTEYGMKPNQYADAQSNTCLYWWDGYKKEILAYAGQGVVPTGRTNSIYSYLSKVTEESPTLAYDDKYHEMLFSINNTESIVFNEVIKAYTAIYDVAFDNKIDFVDRLLLCKPTSVNLWNSHAENTNYMTNVLEYVTNSNPTYTKVYDDMLFECTPDVCDESIKPLMEFEYNTPLGQTGKITNTECSRRERDFRMRIPRAGKEVTTSGTTVWQEEAIGNRLRGKTMDCKLTVTNKTVPFSLQYIINKFRISWS